MGAGCNQPGYSSFFFFFFLADCGDIIQLVKIKRTEFIDFHLFLSPFSLFWELLLLISAHPASQSCRLDLIDMCARVCQQQQQKSELFRPCLRGAASAPSLATAF